MAEGTGDSYLAAARAMAPLVAEHRGNFDRDRNLPPVLVEAMRQAGFFHLWLPRALGGVEMDPLSFFQVTEELSRQDASLGWCEVIPAGAARLAGAMPEAVAREIFGSGHAILAGVINPSGSALAVPGGYRVTGRWSYASGIAHADWVYANCMVGAELRLCLMPRSQLEILDIWHVGGMRATGSNDFQAANLFVPETHTIPLENFQLPVLAPGPLFALPAASALIAGLAAVALGCARGALDALAEIAVIGKSPGTPGLRDRPAVQIDVARAEALLRGGRALLYSEIDTMWRNVQAGRPVTLRERALVRLAMVQAVRWAIEAVDIAYGLAGGAALPQGSRLERSFRDIHVIGQHAALSAQANLESLGQVLLGLQPGMVRF